MKKFLLLTGSMFLASACVGIIDNAGIDDDAGQGSGTIATAGTTGDTTTGVDPTTSTSSTTGDDPTGGVTTSVTTGGYGGASTTDVTTATTATTGAGGGTGGSFGGTGGRSMPDGGSGGRGTGGSRPDGGVAGGGTGGGVVGGATFTQVKAIVQARCANCHRNFADYNTLTTHSVSRCGNDKLATAGDPANSAFLELVQGTNCGGFLMPRGCSRTPCISAADIQTFTDWINAGAPNN